MSNEVTKSLLGYAYEQLSFPEFHLILVCLGMTAMAFWSRFSRYTDKNILDKSY